MRAEFSLGLSREERTSKPAAPLSAAAEQTVRNGRPSGPLLQLIDVSKYFGKTPALSDVNLTVNRGETVAIVGPSGSGKTTLLRCINFLVAYDSGRILVDGRLVGYREQHGDMIRDTGQHVNDIRKRIGMVFQQFNLFPHRTVLGNLIEGPLYVLGIPRSEAVTRARGALELVGLIDKVDAYPDGIETTGTPEEPAKEIAVVQASRPDLAFLHSVVGAELARPMRPFKACTTYDS